MSRAPRLPWRRRYRLLPALAAVLAAVVVAGLGTASPAGAASAAAPMMFGAAGPSRTVVEDHERVLGSTLRGLRVYRQWDDELFGPSQTWARDTGHTLFLSINAQRSNGSRVMWSRIASARPGDPVYADMQRQARQVKAYGGRVFLAFHHEPETTASLAFGNSADFVRAWRAWVSVFRSVGVSNVQYVWTMTAYGFARNDAQRAELYYPGDAWVDDIAADGYNWYRCRERDGKWRSLADVIEAHRAFGSKHPSKGLMLWEFGSAEDKAQPGRKADWFRAATQLFKQPAYRQYRAVLTWEGRAHSGDGPNCGFDYLSSRSATQAWVDMAHDPAYAARRLS